MKPEDMKTLDEVVAEMRATDPAFRDAWDAQVPEHVCQPIGVSGPDHCGYCGAELPPEDPDDDYPGGWFGESWGAAVCDPATHKPTPTDEICVDPECLRPIQPGDQGMVIPYAYAPGKSRLTYEHLDCFLRGLRAGEDA